MSKPTFKVTFIRPYEEAIRLRVSSAIEAAGGEVHALFRPPLDHARIISHLQGHGRNDRLVIPFYRHQGRSGVDLIMTYQNAGDVPRRFLMPSRFALVRVVRDELVRALGSEVADRVLVVETGKITEMTARIAEHMTSS